jgi:hypothetical protein
MTKLERLVNVLAEGGLRVEFEPRLIQERDEVIIEVLFTGERADDSADYLAGAAATMTTEAANSTEKWRVGFRGRTEEGMSLVEFVIVGWGLSAPAGM